MLEVPLAVLLGVIAGAWIYHRGRVNASPLPTAREVKRALTKEEPEPPEPLPFKMPEVKP